MNPCSAVFVSLLFAFLFGGEAQAECRETTLAALKLEAAKKGTITLVFFASWCPSCKDSFTAKPHNTKVGKYEKSEKVKGKEKDDIIYYVAAFDHRQAAEKITQHYGIDAEHCIFDQSEAIARELGVDGVPATRKIKG